MNRIIKFRAQHIKTGQKVNLKGEPVPGMWVYGGILHGPGDHSIIYSAEPDIKKWPVYSDTIGEFTGLTDKNGKEIYEGDICKFKRFQDEYIGVITYLPNPCALVMKYKSIVGAYGEKATHTQLLCHCDDIEIIGNIHDNPKLLEAGNAN